MRRHTAVLRTVAGILFRIADAVPTELARVINIVAVLVAQAKRSIALGDAIECQALVGE